MYFLYDILVYLATFYTKVAAYFSPKMRLFVNGRKKTFKILKSSITEDDHTFWFHAASLGEYEQGVPVMEEMKRQFPEHKIVLTFFSPSGYEVRKNNSVADITVYLPMDTRRNAKRLVSIIEPEAVLFIKYEFWPNLLRRLQKEKIPTYLISGIFRENQVFFKWYGEIFRKALDCFTHFFVQSTLSKMLLNKLHKYNVTTTGDTRFDRVAEILDRDNTLDFMSKFIAGKLAVVIGSSWPKDEEILVNYINASKHRAKFIIAPHNIDKDQIDELRNSLTRKTVLYTEMEGVDISKFDVLIVDTVGILTSIYSYADFAYVGGGFGEPGVHNVLEPAVFACPIVIGPNYSRFLEAVYMTKIGACLPISDQESLNEMFDKVITDHIFRKQTGEISSEFIQMNRGATEKIMKHFERYDDIQFEFIN